MPQTPAASLSITFALPFCDAGGIVWTAATSTLACLAPAARPGTLNIDDSLCTAYDPLTDGLLIVRYMFGLRGASLIAGAIGSGASATTAVAIGRASKA